jgi:hypothetical protein
MHLRVFILANDSYLRIFACDALCLYSTVCACSQGVPDAAEVCTYTTYVMH